MYHSLKGKRFIVDEESTSPESNNAEEGSDIDSTINASDDASKATSTGDAGDSYVGDQPEWVYVGGIIRTNRWISSISIFDPRVVK